MSIFFFLTEARLRKTKLTILHEHYIITCMMIERYFMYIIAYIMIRALTKISLKRSHNSLFLHRKLTRLKLPSSELGKDVRFKD